MTPEELRSRNMVDAAIQSSVKNIHNGKPVMTPEQICLEKANERRVHAARRIGGQLKLLPQRPSFNECVELMYPILRDEFKDDGWSREDFATLACMLLAITGAQALRDEGMI